MHKHIKRDDRVCIALLLRGGHSYTEIAYELGFHRTTITREIKRNSDFNYYDARRAHKRSKEKRKQSKKAYRSIENTPDMQTIIHNHLKEELSPEQIEGRFDTVSFMTIYRYIERNCELKKYLRRKGKKRRRYGTRHILSRYQAHKRSIHERPLITEMGHWEGDTIIGRERRRSILTHVDKISGYLVADLVEHSSDAVHKQVSHSMKRVLCKSITYDNGSEFALHRMIEKDTGAVVYFADAGAPHQRGTNENTNGLIRCDFPKGTSFVTLTNTDLQRVVRKLNNRPRKRLNYLTPWEVFKNGGVHFKC